MSETFCLRRILPNTSDVYVLRVDPYQVYDVSIIAWRLEWTREWGTGKAIGQQFDSSKPWPITPDDDYDEIGNTIEFIVDRGVYHLPMDRSFFTREDAVAYAKAELAKRGA